MDLFCKYNKKKKLIERPYQILKKEFILIKYILKSNPNINKNNIDDIIKDVGEKLGDRITYILRDGIVIADSKVSKKKAKKIR